MRRHEISDADWDRVRALLPRRPGPAALDRLFLNAVLWVAKTGAPWRDLPGFAHHSPFMRAMVCSRGLWCAGSRFTEAKPAGGLSSSPRACLPLGSRLALF